MPEPPIKQQYPAVDLLKYICSIFVVAIHIAPLSSYFDVIPLTAYINFGIKQYLGRLAVPFFFAAAGFFFFRKIDLDHFDMTIAKDYIFKMLRLLGIWTVLLFVGGTFALWFIGAMAIAVVLCSIMLKRHFSLRTMAIWAIFLYIIGLLGDSYYHLLDPLESFGLFEYGRNFYLLVFESTRGGFFMGFPFFLIGGIVQKKKVSLKPIYLIAGFALSMLLIFCEILVIRHFRLSLDLQMYIFLPFATFFLLAFAVNVSLKERPLYRKLRNVSIIVYFTHIFVNWWIEWGLDTINSLFGIQITNSLFIFLRTVIGSTLLGLLIDSLSKKEKWSFLKYLYS